MNNFNYGDMFSRLRQFVPQGVMSQGFGHGGAVGTQPWLQSLAARMPQGGPVTANPGWQPGAPGGPVAPNPGWRPQGTMSMPSQVGQANFGQMTPMGMRNMNWGGGGSY